MKFASKLIHGGQCTFAIDLCNTVNQWQRCTGPIKLRNSPGVLCNMLSVLRNVACVLRNVISEVSNLVKLLLAWPLKRPCFALA